MKKENQAQELEQEWNRATERAAQETERKPTLEFDHIQDGAGLKLQAGVKSGGWDPVCSFSQ